MFRLLLFWLVVTSTTSVAGSAAASGVLFVVTKTADTADGECNSDCSLREAIIAANGSTGLDTINFNIPGPAPHTILVSNDLPEITDPVVIDGQSQPGFADTPVVELAGCCWIGLWVEAGSSTIRSLIINGFGSDGILITGNGSNKIEGNFIGTDATGSTALGNLSRGVGIFGSSDNIIGGTTTLQRNVISGNGFANVDIDGHPTDASRNVIQGNYIGVDVTGAKALEDAPYAVGIWIGGGSDNLIGGSAPGTGNLISGNGEGVRVQDGSKNRIVGNLIGTDANGSQSVANGTGVDIKDSSQNAIGGASPGQRNTISGNTNYGVVLTQSGSLFPKTTENTVQGNYIGVDASGISALANGSSGVTVRVSSGSNLIGGTIPGAGNVISGNARYGVEVDSGSTNNFIQGNFIGTNAAGDQSVGNAWGGVWAGSATAESPNIVGPGNVISGNGGSGILISEWVKVQGNLIGTSANGSGDLGNDKHGVHVDWGARNNEIGGLASSDGNRIAFNGEAGIALTYGALGSNAIHGNMIHSNQGLGIDILADGPTPNDEGDADAGPNGLQNFPVMSEAIATAISTDITGVLDAESEGTYIVEFFVSNTCDATGYGEGAVFLDRMSLSTGPSQTTFSRNLPVTLPIGSLVTATATGADGNSSEFSPCVQVCAPQDFDCDGLSTGSDNCPTVPNPEQDNSDGDLAGDACDTPGSGNVDCNMTVNTVDALKVLRYVAGLSVVQSEPCLDIGLPRSLTPPDNWAMGDVDCSGTVNAVDALKILRAVASLSVAKPEGCPAIGGP